MALVEDHRARAGGAQRLHARPGTGREQVGQAPLVLAAGDLALDRGDEPRQLAGPAALGLPGPGLALPVGLLRRLARRRRPLGRPARPGQRGQGGAGIVDLGERLVGEAGERRARLGPGHPLPRPEPARRGQPLGLNGGVRREDQRRVPDSPGELEAEQGLARAGRRDYVRATAAGLPVALEGRERELLVAAPGAVERKPRERVSRRGRRPRRAASRGPRARSSRPGSAPSPRAGPVERHVQGDQAGAVASSPLGVRARALAAGLGDAGSAARAPGRRARRGRDRLGTRRPARGARPSRAAGPSPPVRRGPSARPVAGRAASGRRPAGRAPARTLSTSAPSSVSIASTRSSIVSVASWTLADVAARLLDGLLARRSRRPTRPGSGCPRLVLRPPLDVGGRRLGGLDDRPDLVPAAEAIDGGAAGRRRRDGSSSNSSASAPGARRRPRARSPGGRWESRFVRCPAGRGPTPDPPSLATVGGERIGRDAPCRPPPR